MVRDIDLANENWKTQRKRIFALMNNVQTANPDADPEEVMKDVLKAQQAVRSQ